MPNLNLLGGWMKTEPDDDGNSGLVQMLQGDRTHPLAFRSFALAIAPQFLFPSASVAPDDRSGNRFLEQ